VTSVSNAAERGRPPQPPFTWINTPGGHPGLRGRGRWSICWRMPPGVHVAQDAGQTNGNWNSAEHEHLARDQWRLDGRPPTRPAVRGQLWDVQDQQWIVDQGTFEREISHRFPVVCGRHVRCVGPAARLWGGQSHERPS